MKFCKRFRKSHWFTFLMVGGVISLTAPHILAQSVTVGEFTLTFEGVTYHVADSTSTWCYTLVWNGIPPQLSHLTIQLGQCAQILSASPPGFIVGLDGSTGIFGIKWNTSIPANTPTQFCFTLDGLYVKEEVKFAAKAGSNNNISNIMGASLVCQECQVQISCPADLVVDCSSAFDPSITGEPTVQGNCPPYQTSYNDQELSSSCTQEKNIQRTWTVVDLAGLSASCQQIISVRDTSDPVLSCAPHKTIFRPDPVIFDTPTVSDNCDPNPTIRILSTEASGTTCPYESVYIRTWQAVDACGNLSAFCSQTASYQNRAPVLTLSDDKTVVRFDTLVISVSALDPDGQIPVLTALNLPSNSYFIDNLNGTGTFVFTPDYFQVGVHPNLTFIASDGCLADTQIIAVNVFVRHDILSLNGYSPINLVVIDPKQDSIGINFNTILEGSSYDTTQDVNGDGEKDDVVKIPNPYLGEYQVRVIPEDTGHFSLGIRIDGNDQVIVAGNVVIPDTDTTFNYQAQVFPTLRGDMNSDAKINLVDIIFLVNFIFKSGPVSNPLALSNLNCDKKADGTDNVNLQDIIYLVNYIFKAGPHPCS